jgi:hypothetical protein
MWRQVAQNIWEATKNESANVQKKTKQAIYEIGKEGDFSRVGVKVVDALLEAIMYDEDLNDAVGDIYSFVDKKLYRYTLNKTKKNKISNKNTRKSRRAH